MWRIGRPEREREREENEGEVNWAPGSGFRGGGLGFRCGKLGDLNRFVRSAFVFTHVAIV